MARVLVVDDEAGIREFLSEALADDDHEVAVAASGEAAWARLEREGFDLVLTDLSMPGMDGMELLRRVREAQPEVEVVVITAHGKVDSAVEAMRLGAFDYLQKPLGSLAELRLLVRRAAERRALRSFREAHVGRDEPELSHGAAVMRPVIDALRKVAATDATVLLVGESGTGKEVAAQAVHRWSRREAGPFVAVNCAALSESLLESELFGHERGAFTGATTRRRGRIELAQGGTFFLDEVGELAPGLQAKLLRVLQERTFERVGGGQTLRADVRWIAATNRDLPAQIAAGRFREDLFYRLNVIPIDLPPLRARRDDIPLLCDHFLRKTWPDYPGKLGAALEDDALRALTAYDWPGNVRELENVLERASIIREGERIMRHDLPPAIATPLPSAASASEAIGTHVPLEQIERLHIEQVLASVSGHKKRAADILQINPSTLYRKLLRYETGEDAPYGEDEAADREARDATDAIAAAVLAGMRESADEPETVAVGDAL